MAKNNNKDGRLPWFPCEAGKLLSALQAMKPHVGYTYWIVCLRIYEIGGPCPDTLEAMTRRTGYSKRIVSEALDVLFRTEKLVRIAGGIMNPYAESVLVEMASRQDRLSARGMRGAVARHKKDEQNQQTPFAYGTDQAVLVDAHYTLTGNNTLPLPMVGGGGTPAPRKAKIKPVAGLIQQDWTPSEGGLAYAGEHGFDARDVQTLVVAFVDHHRMRKNKYEWEAAWRTWVRNEVKFAAERQARQRKQSRHSDRVSF